MSRLDETPSTTAGLETPFVDLPLRHSDAADVFSLPLAGQPTSDDASLKPRAAHLAIRSLAFAADAATVFLVWAAAVLTAAAIRGDIPNSAALPWALGFVLFFSFFAIVPALTLFGKTVGMAVTGLVAQRRQNTRRLTSGEAAWRWLGTLATAATLGGALLITVWSPEAPTPADRLSGRALEDEEESGVGGEGSRV